MHIFLFIACISIWATTTKASASNHRVLHRKIFIDPFNYNLNALSVGTASLRPGCHGAVDQLLLLRTTAPSRKVNGDIVFLLFFHRKPVKGNYQINYASFMSLLIGKFIKNSLWVSMRSSGNWFRSHTQTHTQQSRVLDAWVQCIALRLVCVVRLQSSLIVNIYIIKWTRMIQFFHWERLFDERRQAIHGFSALHALQWMRCKKFMRWARQRSIA